MLLRCVLIDTIRPFVDRDHVTTFLINGTVSRLQIKCILQLRYTIKIKIKFNQYLINKRASMKSGDLTLADIGNLKVCVQQQIEGERQVFAGIVDADMEV